MERDSTESRLHQVVVNVRSQLLVVVVAAAAAAAVVVPTQHV